MFGDKISRKGVLVLICICTLLLGGGYFAALDITVIKIGQHSTHLCFQDARSIMAADALIKDVTGQPRIRTVKDAMYGLVVSAVEKEILAEEQISIKKSDAIESFERDNHGYKGVLSNLKGKFGAEGYYRYVVEPITVANVFSGYYLQTAMKANREKAMETLKLSMADGLEKASKTAGAAMQSTIAPYSALGQDLSAALKSVKPGEIYAQAVPVVSPNSTADVVGYTIIRVKETGPNGMAIDTVYVPRLPFGQFISQKMKEKGVPVDFRFYSVYRESSFESEEGDIFAGGKKS
jgi:hypothetical protein